jgi:hypothetical protein
VLRLSRLILFSALLLPVATMARYSTTAIDFGFLKRVIEEKNVRSVDDLLALLPESFRSHYALMFSSRSLQEASFRDPRVVLYSSDAKFVVTFNGNPAQRGYGALETMEFDENSKKFQFREIDFPPRSSAAEAVKFSESNPEKCLKCHGQPSRPIWDSYPLWPGAYGEREHLPLSKAEHDGLADFLRNQPTHPRYRHLTDSKLFLERDNLLSRSENRYDGSSATDPNSELGSLLSKLNFQMIANEVASSPDFRAYGYALLASLEEDCGSIEDFLPDGLKATFRRNYKQFAEDSDRVSRNQDQLKQLRSLIQVSTENPLPLSTQAGGASAAKFRLIVEQGLGISTDPWTLALEKGTYDFTTPELSMMDIKPYLLQEVSRGDRQVRDLSTTSSSSERYCSFLRDKSLRALSGKSSRVISVSHADHPGQISRPALIERCMECHESGVGPALVFSDPAKLAVELKTRKYPRGLLLDEIIFRLSPEAGAHRMPLGLNTTREERKGLEDYFRSLAK